MSKGGREKSPGGVFTSTRRMSQVSPFTQQPEQDENQSLGANQPPGCRTPAHKSTSKTGEGASRIVQDACFTPSHSLRRSPSLALKRKPDNKDNGASPLLRRSSKKSKPAHSPGRQKPFAKSMPPPEANQKQLPTSNSLPQKVQAQCFSPRCTLKRTPPKKLSPKVMSDLVDDVPPPTRWEIPRTPVQASLLRTPAGVDSQLVTRGETCTNSTNRDKQTTMDTARDTIDSVSIDKDGLEGEGTQDCLVESDSTIVSLMPQQSPPPLSTCKEPVLQLQGLVCTENDLAYLQRRRNVKQYEQLQSQIDQLDKAIKAAAEQKEQLAHKALKVNQDLADMRAKYHQTVSTIHTVIADPTTASQTANQTPQLTLSHVAQLKRVHHLTATQLEKADRELRRKLSDIIREKQEMEMRLRAQEVRIEEQNEELQSQAMKEHAQWEMKIEHTTKEHAAIEERLHDVKSKLAGLKLDSLENQSLEGKERVLSLREKQRGEERLRRVIRRCELYVQRHQMLKEMNARGRKTK